MVTKIVILTLLNFINQDVIIDGACACSNQSYKFIEELRSNDFIGIVEIINYEKRKESALNSYTQVRVIKRYLEDNLSDTLMIRNPNGMDCVHGLHPSKIGAKFIVKINRNSYVDGTDKNRVKLTICAENVLRIKGNEVIGNITKNKLRERRYQKRFEKKYRKAEEPNSDKFMRYFEKRYLQHFSIEKVDRLIQKRS